MTYMTNYPLRLVREIADGGDEQAAAIAESELAEREAERQKKKAARAEKKS